MVFLEGTFTALNIEISKFHGAMFRVLKSEQKVVEGGLSIPEQEHHKHSPSHLHSKASLNSLP